MQFLAAIPATDTLKTRGKQVALFSVAICVFSLGCASGSSSQQPQQSIIITGTWQITPGSSVSGNTVVISGVITQSGSNLSGQLTLSGTPCATSAALAGAESAR